MTFSFLTNNHTNTALLAKKRTLTEMTTHPCHSWSLAITCCHSLLLVIPLVVTSCHSSYHSLSFNFTPCITRLLFYQQLPRNTSNDQKETCACALKSDALTKLKLFQENGDLCFS